MDQEILKDWASELLQSAEFDPAFYAGAAKFALSHPLEAAAHYLLIGERLGLPASVSFDVTFYRQNNPDLEVWDIPLILHFLRHGKREGRAGNLESFCQTGGQPFDRTRETVLVVSHDASRTGSPIHCLSIVRHLARSRNVVTVLLRGGPLTEHFLASSAYLVTPLPSQSQSAFTNILALFPVSCAFIKSLESFPALETLIEAMVPTVVIVSEFAEGMVAKGRAAVALDFATVSVFPAEIVRASARRARADAIERNVMVSHQGLCETPPASAAEIEKGLGPSRPWLNPFPTARLVIGVGSVHIRKGVDLFLAIAKEVTRHVDDKVQFLWIGHGYDPDRDLAYSVWLREQLIQTELQDRVSFLGELSAEALSSLYGRAELFLLTSRQDPFPNVGIEAMSAGLPVVCFAKASGIAEFLQAKPETAELVVPYLDTTKAAELAVRLLSDQPSRERLAEAVRARSASFDMARYMNDLEAASRLAVSLNKQERLDIQTIIEDGCFEPDLYNGVHAPPRTPSVSVRRYVRFSASGSLTAERRPRRPSAGFNPLTFIEAHPQLLEAPYKNPLAEFIRRGKPAGRWQHEVIKLDQPISAEVPPSLRVALNIHVHYPEILAEILEALSVNRTRMDLLICTNSQEVADEASAMISSWRPEMRTIIKIGPNRGRDVGSLLTGLADVVFDYDVVGHVHTKRTPRDDTEVGPRWRRFLFQHLLGTDVPAADRILSNMASRPELGLVFPEDPNIIGWSTCLDEASALWRRIAPGQRLPEHIEFPVGTMFWARTAALRPLFDLGLSWQDYPPEPLPLMNDGTILHAIERLLPLVCEHAGYSYATSYLASSRR